MAGVEFDAAVPLEAGVKVAMSGPAPLDSSPPWQPRRPGASRW